MTVAIVANIARPISSAISTSFSADSYGLLSSYGLLGGSAPDLGAAIKALFASGEQGAIYDYMDKANLSQDSAGTIPVTTYGDPIGRVTDLSGNNNHALQATSGQRPMYLGSANLDGVDDGFVVSSMSWGATSTQITMVISVLENYQTYLYGILSKFTSSNDGSYIGRLISDEFEVNLGNPAFHSGPYPRGISEQVIDLSLDTVPATAEQEIIHNIDGQVINQTVHVAGRTWGSPFISVNHYIGIWDESGTYPVNGEIYRQITINRALTTEEMALARAWCAGGRTRQQIGFTADLNMFQITGQSLAEGGKGAPVTTAQEYDNVMFTLRESSPTAYVPAVNVTTDLETPMYGQIGHVKALIAGQSGASGYQMLGCNNGLGSASITILNKGNPTFTAAMSQVAAAKTIADGLGKTFKFRAVSFVQGEADNAMSRTDYALQIKKLASQYNEQGKRNAKQPDDVIFITSQISSNALPNVALAQLDAAIENHLVYLSTPLYPFNFYSDGVHLLAESSKILGGYMGLVYKKVLFDGVNWKPLMPISHTQSGNDVTITFHVPEGSLVLDTTLIQAQTNYGFSACDSGGVDIPISSVTLVDTDKVKITTSSQIPSGGCVNYAQVAQTAPIRSLGGCGNLRDSQGDTLTYRSWPMHNWCVIFREVI